MAVVEYTEVLVRRPGWDTRELAALCIALSCCGVAGCAIRPYCDSRNGDVSWILACHNPRMNP